jgi:hypothetical protein
MKTAYTITLDKEKVDLIKVWLEQRGLSFSGYLNSLIDAQLTAIEMFSPLNDKKKVTTSSMIKLAGKMAKHLTKELKK